MAELETTKIKGLELWIPSDSFQQDYNIAPLRNAMVDFQTLGVLHKPEDKTLFCSGRNQVIYHTVEESAVARREARLHKLPAPLKASLEADQVVDTPELREEARVRELHLGLGRTSLFLATNAVQPDEFMKATHDLKYLFSMLNQPIHSLDSLSDTSLHDSGLIYLYVQAARRFKTLSRENATELADALGKGILPFSTSKKGKVHERWGDARAKSFVDRISFTQTNPTHVKRRKNSKKTAAGKAKGSYTLHRDPMKSKRERQQERQRTKAEIFISRLLRDRRLTSYSEKLANTHETFFGEKPQAFEVRNDSKLDIAKLAVGAYLEAMSKRENDPAGQISQYLAKKKGNYKRPLLALIVIGNLATAKINDRNGARGAKRELPGLNAKGIPVGFKALRLMLETNHKTKKNLENKMLGDIVEGYLEAAFPPSDEEGYQILPAPEGFVSTADFAHAHDIDQKTLERAMGNYGVDPNTYRFQQYTRKGLSPDDQELLLSVRHELQVERAPQGYRSISSFALISHAPKSEVDRLIKEHDIETGWHRFRSRATTSLDPKAQEKLSKLLAAE